MRWPLLLLLVSAFFATADAKFADTQGFSGKHGVTCNSCHVPEQAPTGEPAVAHLVGLPGSWDLNRSYVLTISVEGGPIANPAPRTPQAGFDLEVDAGRLGEGPDMQGLLRFPSELEATYTGEGTLRRQWSVLWTSPGLEGQPGAVRFWLGVVAANGNHVMGGPDAAGERGDRTAVLEASVPASEAAQRAWQAQPLEPPAVDPLRKASDGAWIVTGRVADHADGAEWSLDGGPWSPAFGTPSFVITIAQPNPAKEIAVRAVQGERASQPVTVVLTDPSPAASPVQTAPAAGLPLVLWSLVATTILLPLALRIRRRTP